MALFSLARRRISIHAPREGGDLTAALHERKGFQISIHAPREGGDTALTIYSFLP